MEITLKAQVQQLLAQVFQVPLEEIGESLAFGDIPQWDSMGHMDVMISLEEKYGIEITAESIAALVSIPAICAFLSEKAYHV